MYDLIGDLHGHADELTALLTRLGYGQREGVYRHPERQVIFLGDFIDRGPAIDRVLAIVRPMIETGAALAVLGNHELNALAFHTRSVADSARFARPRTDRTFRQHRETLAQLTASELASALDWFRTLPLWLDLGDLRVVHACWDSRQIGVLTESLAEGGLSDRWLTDAYTLEHPTFLAVDDVLKGKELPLPPGQFHVDKDGTRREKFRIRWFESPSGRQYSTYAMTDVGLPNDRLPESVADLAEPYPPDAPPVFVGHYWLTGTPAPLAPNVACLDYSVAKGGRLCAYRWDGERELSADKFVSVEAKS